MDIIYTNKYYRTDILTQSNNNNVSNIYIGTYKTIKNIIVLYYQKPLFFF